MSLMKVQRTYVSKKKELKKKRTKSYIPKEKCIYDSRDSIFGKNSYQSSTSNILYETLDDSHWKDDFDKLLDDKSELRKKNMLKTDVRASYNMDSSIDGSDSEDDKTASYDSVISTPEKYDISTIFLNAGSPMGFKSTPIPRESFPHKSIQKQFDYISNSEKSSGIEKMIDITNVAQSSKNINYSIVCNSSLSTNTIKLSKQLKSVVHNDQSLKDKSFDKENIFVTRRKSSRRSAKCSVDTDENEVPIINTSEMAIINNSLKPDKDDKILIEARTKNLHPSSKTNENKRQYSLRRASSMVQNLDKENIVEKKLKTTHIEQMPEINEMPLRLNLINNKISIKTQNNPSEPLKKSSYITRRKSSKTQSLDRENIINSKMTTIIPFLDATESFAEQELHKDEIIVNNNVISLESQKGYSNPESKQKERVSKTLKKSAKTQCFDSENVLNEKISKPKTKVRFTEMDGASIIQDSKENGVSSFNSPITNNRAHITGRKFSKTQSLDKENVIEVISCKTTNETPGKQDPQANIISNKLKNLNKLSLRKSKRVSRRSHLAKEDLLLKPRKTVMFSETINDSSIAIVDDQEKLILPSGKWRKSLQTWRRTHELANEDNDQNRKSLRSKSVNRKSIHHRITMELDENPTPDAVNKILIQLHESLSESIVLEQTDDGVCNLSKLSLLDESDSGRRFSRQYSVQIKPTFNEESENHIKYRTSVYRRRKTSFVDPTKFEKCTRIDVIKELNSKDIVLRRCRQTEPLEFSQLYSEDNLKTCRKIGEGVYGEVFMNKTSSGEAVVLKIIPIEGDLEINGEPQKKFDEILAEIVIAMELSNLRNGKDFMTNGFVEVINVRCVKGRYPEHLIELWELYRDNRGTDNDHPEIFSDDQLYIVLELANAGQDLEAFNFNNALQSYSAFIQTAITLAVAESKFQFEHRDLHWGNILLIATDDKEVVFKLNGKDIKIPTHGVKATIIDYTLSRMVFEGCCFYNDLAHDDELFSASGDYQFDIYRFMKTRLENKWERYEPYTNILWLHYTIDKMISGARYRNNKNKKHRSAIQDMMQLRDELLDYKNSSDYIKCLY